MLYVNNIMEYFSKFYIINYLYYTVNICIILYYKNFILFLLWKFKIIYWLVHWILIMIEIWSFLFLLDKK